MSAARGTRDPAEVVRFILTGALNTLFGFGIYSGLVLLGMEAAAALLVATVAGVIFNFFSFGTLTFRRPGVKHLPRFVLAYAALYAFNLALLWAVQRVTGIGAIAGQLLCLGVVAPCAYGIMKRQVFRE